MRRCERLTLWALLVAVGVLVPGCFFVVGNTICGSDLDWPCGKGYYCKYDEGTCGGDGAVGVCTEVPDVCTEIYQPVCGCDGTTYANPCFAESAGVNVASDGECTNEG